MTKISGTIVVNDKPCIVEIELTVSTHFDPAKQATHMLLRSRFTIKQNSVAPRHVILVLDTSNSMRGSLETLKEAASDLVGKLNETDDISLILFDETAKCTLTYAKQEAAKEAIKKITQLGERTNITDALLATAPLLNNRPDDIHSSIVILLTDGDNSDKAPQNAPRAVINRLKANLKGPLPQFLLIGLGSDYQLNYFNELSQATGTHDHTHLNANKMVEFFQGIPTILNPRLPAPLQLKLSGHNHLLNHACFANIIDNQDYVQVLEVPMTDKFSCQLNWQIDHPSGTRKGETTMTSQGLALITTCDLDTVHDYIENQHQQIYQSKDMTIAVKNDGLTALEEMLSQVINNTDTRDRLHYSRNLDSLCQQIKTAKRALVNEQDREAKLAADAYGGNCHRTSQMHQSFQINSKCVRSNDPKRTIVAIRMKEGGAEEILNHCRTANLKNFFKAYSCRLKSNEIDDAITTILSNYKNLEKTAENLLSIMSSAHVEASDKTAISSAIQEMLNQHPLISAQSNKVSQETQIQNYFDPSNQQSPITRLKMIGTRLNQTDTKGKNAIIAARLLGIVAIALAVVGILLALHIIPPLGLAVGVTLLGLNMGATASLGSSLLCASVATGLGFFGPGKQYRQSASRRQMATQIDKANTYIQNTRPPATPTR